ncbi:MAG TPA: redoxin domain-containing protein, partial [Flavobacteriales bacterium]|nr:redoxin domain-containing protein [Flavobacteriales bacterium]
YTNTITGEVKEYDTGGAYPWDDSTYTLVENSNRIVELKPGIVSQVQDFHLTDRDGMDLTDGILAEENPVLLVMMYNLKKTDTSCIPAIKKLTDDAQAKGWYVYAMSTNSWEDMEAFRHEHQLAFDFTQGDEKVIKTVIRSNPGVVLLKKGTVMGLWSCADVPTLEEAMGKVK